jgi:hypothetical protein
MKRFTALLAAVFAVVMLAAPAAAATPLVLERHNIIARLFPSEPLCDDFTVTSEFQVSRSIVQYYDQSGALLREVRHIFFTGTQTNDATGTWLPVDGNFHQVFNFVDGTFTTTGSGRHVTLPGSGIVLHDSGRIVINMADESALFLAGPHQDLLGDYTAMCAALAGS